MTQNVPAQPPSGAVPVCPRHPDRISYVRCQRCEQPVCPQCQVPSSVGVHCVDCVRKARSSRPAARSILGARASADALVTKVLLAACVVVYLLQMMMPGLLSQLAFAPAAASGQPYRFLTAAFLHASIMHIAFNMWALWVVGSTIEPVLGRWRFLSLYFLSALGGSAAVLWLTDPDSYGWITATVGASGAVFGMFAALFVIQRRFGRDTSAIMGLLAINLVISVLGANISWQAHLGGLLTGGILAAVYAWAPRERRTLVGVFSTVGIAVVLIALCALRYAVI